MFWLLAVCVALELYLRGNSLEVELLSPRASVPVIVVGVARLAWRRAVWQRLPVSRSLVNRAGGLTSGFFAELIDKQYHNLV